MCSHKRSPHLEGCCFLNGFLIVCTVYTHEYIAKEGRKGRKNLTTTRAYSHAQLQYIVRKQNGKWTLVDHFRSTAVSTVKCWRKTRSFGSGECRGNMQVSSTYPFHHQVGSYKVEAMMAVPSFYGLLSPLFE